MQPPHHDKISKIAKQPQRLSLFKSSPIVPHTKCTDERFENFAREIGTVTGRLPDEQKAEYIHELDAVVAQLYGLTAEQLTNVFETFHEGWDYQDRLDATLKHFHSWNTRL